MSSTPWPAVELSDEDWLPCEQLLERFEQAWQQGLRPALDGYLPGGAERLWAVLVELIHTDLEFRLKAGEAVRVEEYLRRYPELARHYAAAVGLIRAEYDLRRRREPDLGTAEYLARFPQHAAGLRAEWQTWAAQAGDCVPAPSPGTTCGSSPYPDRAAEAPPVESRLGKYQLLEVAGRGSFGVVYRAYDTELDRVVAVKVPRPGSLAGPDETDRFLREARSAAPLQHPHIVRLHEVGQGDGPCYLVYEYVAGTTLAEVLARGRPGFREAAEMVAQAAEALDYAHRQGVVHRDIKPSNLLLDPAGRPHILDFGLARRQTAANTLTQEGELLGTPAYMSPEQARGEARRVDGRSDVYSLGVVLYELLTGEVPFRGEPRRLLAQVLEDEPRRPRGLDGRIPRDLETVCLKCLEKEPGRRYPTAGALAADLRRWLAGLSVQARPVGPAGRWWRWARRRPGPAVLAAALLLVTGLGFGGVLWQWRQAVANLALAEHQRQRAEANRRQAQKAVNEFIQISANPLLHDTPGLDPVRLELTEKALKYLEGFLEHWGEDPALRTDVAMLTLHQAWIYIDTPGHWNALGPAQKALGLWQELAREDPARPEYRRYEASAHAVLGQAQWYREQREEALRSFQRACDLFLALPHPLDRQARQELAVCYVHLALLERARGRRAETLAWYQKANALAEQLVQEAPTALAVRFLLWRTRSGLADAHGGLNHSSEALRAWGEATAAMKPLVEDYPVVPEFQACLAVGYHCQGRAAVQLGQYPEAIRLYQLALAIREKLCRDEPESAKRRSDVGGNLYRLAIALEKAGRLEEAEKVYRQVLDNQRILIAMQPQLDRHRRWLNDRAGDLARVRRQLGLPEAMPERP